MMKKLLTLLLLSISIIDCYSQDKNIDSLIIQAMETANIPGIAIARIDSSRISWEKYFGYSDFEKQVPISKESTFLLSSVSKTITSAALMKLYGEGKLSLDDDINDYLNFKIINPNHPNQKITFRQLLRHRSSIKDNYQYLMPFWMNNQGDSDIELKKFIKEYLTPEGMNYSAEGNFDNAPPGAYFNYSNIGFALIGLLIEEITEMPFNKYCEEVIFKELEMSNSKWFLSDLEESKTAKQYEFNESKDEFDFVGFSGFPDYPAGQLRSTINDYSKFLMTWMNFGKWNEKQIFSPLAINELTPPDFMLGVGFHTWFLYTPSKDEIIYSHFGSDKGSFAFTAFNPRRKKAIAVFINGSIDKEKNKIVYEMIEDLYNKY